MLAVEPRFRKIWNTAGREQLCLLISTLSLYNEGIVWPLHHIYSGPRKEWNQEMKRRKEKKRLPKGRHRELKLL